MARHVEISHVGNIDGERGRARRGKEEREESGKVGRGKGDGRRRVKGEREGKGRERRRGGEKGRRVDFVQCIPYTFI